MVELANLDVGLYSDSESEAGVEVKVLEATPVLHENEEENESEEEDEVVEHTEAAHAAVRQAEAEGLTLQPADNKAGYRGVYKEGCKATFRAKVRRAGKSMHLGSFSTAEEAALAYARTPEARGEVATSNPAPLTAEEAVEQATAEGLNLEPSEDGASGYRGVTLKGFRYHARLMSDGRRARLGSFATAEEATLTVARAVACTVPPAALPRPAAAKRAAKRPNPPSAKQPGSSLAAGALPSVSDSEDGIQAFATAEDAALASVRRLRGARRAPSSLLSLGMHGTEYYTFRTVAPED